VAASKANGCNLVIKTLKAVGADLRVRPKLGADTSVSPYRFQRFYENKNYKLQPLGAK
jgi:hypothetical protein